MFTSSVARFTLAALVATLAVGTVSSSASAAFKGFSLPQQTIRNSSFSTPASTAAWTKLHTVAPSRFNAPLRTATITKQPIRTTTFTGPAAGPPGAQFGKLPITNKSFIDPTRNSLNAKQTKNSVQTTNAVPSTNAVQGKNCSQAVIRAGLCQGR